jgi:hypothetical protein
MAGDCGTCTLCCKVLGIKEFDKPINQWCKHTHPGKGCKIYETRPQSCHDYACVWLQSQEAPNALPPEMRPDKCKVVMTFPVDQEVITCHVDPGFPAAWQEGPFSAFLYNATTDQGKKPLRFLVKSGSRSYFVQNGQAREVELSDMDEDGVQHVVKIARP